MKLHAVFFSVSALLSLLFFCAGCDDSSDAQKLPVPEKRAREKTNLPELPKFRKKDEAPKKAEDVKEKSAKPQENAEEKNKSDSARQKEKPGELSQKGTGRGQGGGTGEGGGSSSGSQSGTGRGGTGGGTGSSSGGGSSSGSGTGGGTGRGSHTRDGDQKTAPPGWTSSEVKQAPTAADSEIWANIISNLENLIAASEVKFSSLGAMHTSLTSLPDSKYKARGRCLVVDKNGNQFAYEFECIARVNKYEALILSVQFTER